MTGVEFIGLSALGGTVASAYFLRRIRAHNTRAEQLRRAEVFLQHHNEAVEEFTGSFEVDADVRRYVLFLADALTDDKLVCSVAQALLASRGKPKSLLPSSPLKDALVALAKEHPSLLIILLGGLEAGFLGAFLRVPDTAARFDELLPLVVAGHGTAAQEAVQLAGHFKWPQWIGASLNGTPQPA